ncbi:hypothetical protein SDC9_138861 [bioreactor metagenome]|uniref:Uncharacterized protein n=1 Tax=bioreactor metagenome TaxID=1076179 RepID=A0A645DR47_9ZZZZ
MGENADGLKARLFDGTGCRLLLARHETVPAKAGIDLDVHGGTGAGKGCGG